MLQNKKGGALWGRKHREKKLILKDSIDIKESFVNKILKYMTKEEYCAKILEALASVDGVDASGVTANTKFSDIENLDSMSMVNLQMNLREVIGDKADQVSPVMDMTVSDLAELFASL